MGTIDKQDEILALFYTANEQVRLFRTSANMVEQDLHDAALFSTLRRIAEHIIALNLSLIYSEIRSDAGGAAQHIAAAIAAQSFLFQIHKVEMPLCDLSDVVAVVAKIALSFAPSVVDEADNLITAWIEVVSQE